METTETKKGLEITIDNTDESFIKPVWTNDSAKVLEESGLNDTHDRRLLSHAEILKIVKAKYKID